MESSAKPGGAVVAVGVLGSAKADFSIRQVRKARNCSLVRRFINDW